MPSAPPLPASGAYGVGVGIGSGMQMQPLQGYGGGGQPGDRAAYMVPMAAPSGDPIQARATPGGGLNAGWVGGLGVMIHGGYLGFRV